jgi:hypothetical protein
MNIAFNRLALIDKGLAFCTGMEILGIAGLAAAAAGTGLSIAGAKQSQENMNKAVQAELARQQGYQQTGQKLFTQSLEGSTPPKAQSQISSGQEAALGNYQKLASLPLGGDVTTAFPVGDKAIAQNVSDYVSQRQQAGSYLQGLGQYGVDQYVKDILANARLGINAANSQFSESVLPLEIGKAQQSGAELAGIGQLVSALGSTASTASAIGGGFGKGKTATVTPKTMNVGQVYPGIDPYGLNSLVKRLPLYGQYA